MTDREILDLLKEDDEKGLYALIEKYNAYVKSIISRVLLHHPADVEECVADTFIAIWKKKDSMELQADSLKGLLACIARNTAINRYKILKREQQVEINCESLVAEDEIESLIDTIYQQEVVTFLLRSLKEPHREIFLRRHVFMETVAEIANDLKMDERQIRNSLYRSKKKLRAKLKGESDERGVV